MIQFVVYQQGQWIGVASSWIEAVMTWERWADEVAVSTRKRPSDRHQRIEERRGPHPRWRDRQWLNDVCAGG